MFKCDACGRTTRPNEKCKQVTIRERKVVYNNGSEGHEIVEEQSMCSRCARIYESYYQRKLKEERC